MKNYNLDRFLNAQDHSYYNALSEIKNGRKETHWMWFIFPQIEGLGETPTSNYYSIKSLEEAKLYLSDETLGSRLRIITNELLKLKSNNPYDIFSDIDTMKLKSSMTLFDQVENDSVFSEVLKKYFNSEKDELTLEILGKEGTKHV